MHHTDIDSKTKLVLQQRARNAGRLHVREGCKRVNRVLALPCAWPGLDAVVCCSGFVPARATLLVVRIYDKSQEASAVHGLFVGLDDVRLSVRP